MESGVTKFSMESGLTMNSGSSCLSFSNARITCHHALFRNTEKALLKCPLVSGRWHEVEQTKLSLTCLLFLRETEGEVLNPICFHQQHQLRKGAWWEGGLQSSAYLKLCFWAPSQGSLRALWAPQTGCFRVNVSAVLALEKAICVRIGDPSSIGTPPTQSPEENKRREGKPSHWWFIFLQESPRFKLGPDLVWQVCPAFARRKLCVLLWEIPFLWSSWGPFSDSGLSFFLLFWSTACSNSSKAGSSVLSLMLSLWTNTL